jgi:cell division protease FtsH
MPGREAILKVHSKGKPIAPKVGLDVIAKQTPGFSGADLANLVNESAILTARRSKKRIGLEEFEEAIDRVIAGPERRSHIIGPKEKKMVAYHEAGHALAAWMLPNADTVHKISIVARGAMGGYTRLLPKEDRNLWTKNQFEDMLATALGGRVAEEIMFGEVTTGASNDLETATRVALKMVKQYGMSSSLGPRTLGRRQELVFLGREMNEERDYSDKVAEEIDQEVQKLIKTAYSRATEILETHREKLVEVAEYLIREESVEGEELLELFGMPAASTDDLRTESSSSEVPSQPEVVKPAKARGVGSRQKGQSIVDGDPLPEVG